MYCLCQVLINCFIRRAGSSYGGGGGYRRRSGVIIRVHCRAIRIEEGDDWFVHMHARFVVTVKREIIGDLCQH